jgi:hypothetical protein
MTFLPFFSLAAALFLLWLAWRQRATFSARPYFFWFLYLHLAAVGLHQFEEYGWPGGFREVFAGVFANVRAASAVPSSTVLAMLNVFGFLPLFGLVGWLGTRVIPIGLGLLFLNFGNGFFHLVHAVTHLTYVPGVVTGTLLYLPLALLATRFAVVRNEIGTPQLLLAFFLGTAASFAPFVEVWVRSR